jgi:hypothetical protein
MTKPTRGGSRPNAGRPTIAEPAKNRTIRLTDADWLRLKAAGGAPWVRLMLDKELK